MRIRMLKTRLFRVPSNRRKSYEYKENRAYTVKREWGDEMVAAGEAEGVATPARAPARTRRQTPASE